MDQKTSEFQILAKNGVCIEQRGYVYKGIYNNKYLIGIVIVFLVISISMQSLLLKRISPGSGASKGLPIAFIFYLCNIIYLVLCLSVN